jgi:hypothetical protein
MIADLRPEEYACLEAFFAPPNELSWAELKADTTPALTGLVQPWLDELVRARDRAAVVLPVIKFGAPVGWYATSVDRRSSDALVAELRAWLGPSYLARFAPVAAGAPDPRLQALRNHFGGELWLLAGATPMDNAKIAKRLGEFAKVRSQRPSPRPKIDRPVGRIRADFDRALLAQDEHRATELLGELRSSGRLNEENLRYLEVRLQAGLGYWPQIARNPWLIATLSDLRPPPQTLADLIEALYRTFIEPLEASGAPDQVLQAFEAKIARPYPRLFASRRGVRSPRVVKAFLLFERLRSRPTAALIAELRDLLPEVDRRSSIYSALPANIEPAAPPALAEDEAEAAFDDGEFDRAFELYMVAQMGRKTLNRLLLCIDHIGVDGRVRLAARLATADPALLGELSGPQQRRLTELQSPPAAEMKAQAAPANPWMAWAEQLRDGQDLAAAERAVSQASVTWDISPFHASETLSARFADLIGNLSGESAAIARQSVAALISAFLPPGVPASSSLRPIAVMLFMLLAMDEPLSQADLELLGQLAAQRLALGLSAKDYGELVRDLSDVRARVASYANLPWSLDICEALALAPAPGVDAQAARLGFFMSVLGQAQGLGHRLQSYDLATLDLLSKDFQVEQRALDWLRQVRDSADRRGLPDLTGKRIAIYTLAAAAGARAKTTLETLYPGCRVDLNCDLVCTAQLTNLAKVANIFVFAWKSSSHQSFYCVKDAMAPREPLWAAGKGTASIVRAVADSLQ